MTPPLPARRHFSSTRAFAIARVRVHRVLRSRLALAAGVLALLPWLLVDSDALVARMSSLAEFTLVGLTVLGAGALSDDIDSGEYAVAVSHECSPLDVLAGQSIAAIGSTTVLVALQLPLAFTHTTIGQFSPLVLSFAWLAALLAGWIGLMLLLATFLEGKSNAVAMGGVMAIVPLLLRGGVLEHLPPSIASFLRAVLQLVPQLAHVTAMFRALLGGTAQPNAAPLILLVSPIIFFALASVRLYRLEPAGRLTQ
jgi:hypothetical protein